MRRADAQPAGKPAKLTASRATAAASERCSLRFALSAARTPRYPSSLGATGQFTARIATARGQSLTHTRTANRSFSSQDIKKSSPADCRGTLLVADSCLPRRQLGGFCRAAFRLCACRRRNPPHLWKLPDKTKFIPEELAGVAIDRNVGNGTVAHLVVPVG